MALEQILDWSANTTVAAGGYTSGSGVLNVASTSLFGATGNFSISIFRDDLLIVQLRVSAINSGTQFAVTAEGADANALEDDSVYAVLSKTSVEQLLANVKTSGPYASLPATGRAGSTYICTDSPYEFVHNGSAWVPYMRGIPHNGPITIPPTVASLTWVNQSTATADSSKGVINFRAPRLGTGEARAGLFAGMPARAFNFEVGVICNGLTNQIQYSALTLMLRDSASGKLIEFLYNTTNGGSPGMAAQRMNSPTSYGSGEESYFVNYPMPWVYLRWELEAGSTGKRRMYFCQDGENWIRYGTSTIQWDTFCTPDQIGVGVINWNGGTVPDVTIQIFHWKVY